MNIDRVKVLHEVVYTIRDLAKTLEEKSTASLAAVHATELLRITKLNLEHQSAAHVQAEQVRFPMFSFISSF